MSPQLDTVIAATLVGYREESLRAPQSERTRRVPPVTSVKAGPHSLHDFTKARLGSESQDT